MKNLLTSWPFLVGTGVIVFAYFTAKGSSEQTGEGLNNALTLVGIGAGAGLLIYAINQKGPA